MMTTTERGDRFASKLNPYVGTTYQIRQTCARIHRLAVTYERIQEAWCCDERTADPESRYTKNLERRELGIMNKIMDHVRDLPEPDDGPWRVQFDGDPRGYTVRLIAPDGRELGVYEGAL
jgi:hypothetical protein